MAKKAPDRFEALATNIGSPQIVASIDKALEDNRRERLDLLELRKIAVRRHGGPEIAQPEAIDPRMLVGGFQESVRGSAFDGTIQGLVGRYLTDEGSPIHQLRHSTKNGYTRLFDRIVADVGEEKLPAWNARVIQSLYDRWTDGGKKVSMGHALITMLRLLFGYGASMLEDNECARLSNIMRNMRFSAAKRRGERMTAEHAVAIIEKAHETGSHSVALAQAFQFDCAMRQKDVIGEWVPLTEPGDSDVMLGDEKWLRGLRWSAINGDLFLRHPPSMGGPDIEFDLNYAPRVMAELDSIQKKFGKLPVSGPVIVDEETELPYQAWRFRRRWRDVADEAGVPADVWNTDSRLMTRPPREREREGSLFPERTRPPERTRG